MDHSAIGSENPSTENGFLQQNLYETQQHEVDPNSSTLKRLHDDSNQESDIPAKRSIMDDSTIQMGRPYIGQMDNICETIQIPENTVGLVIGKGGSEIQNIQSLSGCHLQMSPDSEVDGSGLRKVTLQGSKISCDRAKQLISEVVTRATSRNAPNVSVPTGPSVVTEDVMIPANKCGLIIGKQGETIKALQEQAGCKMQMIQDTQEVTGMPKPLRISGDRERVEAAKKLVVELLAREDSPAAALGLSRTNHMSNVQPNPNTMRGEVLVPRTSVGIIIGKGGETIKRLAAETGTKIQFKPDDDPSTTDRCAVIMGTREQIYRATDIITELVNKSANNNTAANNTMQTETFFMHVPTTKTGLVIGKGGETIKQINSESGAHCELSRDPPPNSHEKVFIIKGNAFQIHHAQHIIRIKVGDIAPNTPVPPLDGRPMPQLAANNGYGQPAPQYAQFAQQMAPQMNQWGQQQYPQQIPQQPGNQWSQQQYYAAAQNQQQYLQGQQGYMAQQQQQPQIQGQAQPMAQATMAVTPQSQPTINPATGQPDYSAQWAEYYRSSGQPEKAEMIEKQAAAARAGAATAQPAVGATAQQQQPQQQYAYQTAGANQTATSFPATGQYQTQA